MPGIRIGRRDGAHSAGYEVSWVGSSAVTRTEGLPTAPSVRKRRLRRRRARALALLAVVVLVAAGGLLVVHLSSNVRTSALSLGVGTAPVAHNGPETNILVMGTDTRRGQMSFKSSEGAVGQADVELLVHIPRGARSADVVSIPRDLITTIPECASGGRTYPAQARAQVNDALTHGGPGCQVATVEQLTGLPIDHFVLVDFNSVITLSNIVGGVPVCVTGPVDDPQSGLRLHAGTNVIQGATALAFLRTRHGFGNGSDLGRIQAQHEFLASLARTMKSSSTMRNPVKLYRLADAATKSLTVDHALGNVVALTKLATQLNAIPSGNITFETMPVEPAPGNANRVVAQPSAAALWQRLADDSPAPATRTARPTPVAHDAIPVAVYNGTTATGRARQVADALVSAGYTRAAVGGQAETRAATTTVTYSGDGLALAQTVAQTLGLPPQAVVSGTTAQAPSGGVVVVIGRDFTTGSRYEAAQTPAAQAPTAAPAGSITAASTGCVPVAG